MDKIIKNFSTMSLSELQEKLLNKDDRIGYLYTCVREERIDQKTFKEAFYWLMSLSIMSSLQR